MRGIIIVLILGSVFFVMSACTVSPNEVEKHDPTPNQAAVDLAEVHIMPAHSAHDEAGDVHNDDSGDRELGDENGKDLAKVEPDEQSNVPVTDASETMAGMEDEVSGASGSNEEQAGEQTALSESPETSTASETPKAEAPASGADTTDDSKDRDAVQQRHNDSKPMHYKDKVLVLMYHHIHELEATQATLSPEKFETHIQALLDHGYHIISMEQFIAYQHEEAAVPDNAVLLTFDDGYKSFYESAYPILQKYEVTATHFVIGAMIDQEHPAFMNWDQMREMKAAGMSFYSHTYDLHYYTEAEGSKKQLYAIHERKHIEELDRRETEEEYAARIMKDLEWMNERLKVELDQEEAMLAFPYGEYNPTVLGIARELGIRTLFTTIPGIHKRGQSLIKRINAGSPDMTAELLLETLKVYDE